MLLLSKLEAGTKTEKGGGKKWNNFRSKSRWAVMFATLEIIVFLFFFVVFCVCMLAGA